ncbi:MAG: hypothetical protein SVM79_02525 [Chloroflexota bacterium]|nr:hypothetical protein [Chloroflexota bacterium]
MKIKDIGKKVGNAALRMVVPECQCDKGCGDCTTCVVSYPKQECPEPSEPKTEGRR